MKVKGSRKSSVDKNQAFEPGVSWREYGLLPNPDWFRPVSRTSLPWTVPLKALAGRFADFGCRHQVGVGRVLQR